jgi:Animal haem peroxidase
MSTAEKTPNFGQKVLIGIGSLLPRGGAALGLPRLLAFRSVLQSLNLYPGPIDNPLPPTSSPPAFRTGDASGNNPQNPSAGTSGAAFGRNMPAADGNVDDGPPVQLVAQKLLARKKFVPAGDQLNVLAAVWIQGMAHDWMGHIDGAETVELTEGAAAGCPLKAFRFPKTSARTDKAFVNARTHWWDASFLYGQGEVAVRRARTMRDGKLHQGNATGILPVAEDGTPLVGDPKNGWIGVSLLQDLFLREHNLVAETLAREHPEMAGDDEKLFNTTRLVISAVVAKIHTIDCKLYSVRAEAVLKWFVLERFV